MKIRIENVSREGLEVVKSNKQKSFSYSSSLLSFSCHQIYIHTYIKCATNIIQGNVSCEVNSSQSSQCVYIEEGKKGSKTIEFLRAYDII